MFLAQRGDPFARRILLLRNKSFVIKTAERVCGRPLQWGIDEEATLALRAFDEAIDSFVAVKGDEFFDYARKLIWMSLCCYLQKMGLLSKDNIKQMIEYEKILVVKASPVSKKEKISRLWEKNKVVLEKYGLTREDLLPNKQKEPGLVPRLKHKLQTVGSALRKYLAT